ncbi:MAG: hypothetical protein SFX73_33120 [Kofleriaceae bacterium]|nr:hypothetical protein [Kofleriaceae bacterium]
MCDHDVTAPLARPMHRRHLMHSLNEHARWMGPTEYENDPKQIRIVMLGLPIAAALFAYIMARFAIFM